MYSFTIIQSNMNIRKVKNTFSSRKEKSTKNIEIAKKHKMHIDKNEKKAKKAIRRNVTIIAMITVDYSIKIMRDSSVKSNEKNVLSIL